MNNFKNKTIVLCALLLAATPLVGSQGPLVMHGAPLLPPTHLNITTPLPLLQPNITMPAINPIPRATYLTGSELGDMLALLGGIAAVGWSLIFLDAMLFKASITHPKPWDWRCFPLYCAQFLQAPRLTKFALWCGADPCAQDATGNTMLHYAAILHPTMVPELIKAAQEKNPQKPLKTLVNLKNKSGETPLDTALEEVELNKFMGRNQDYNPIISLWDAGGALASGQSLIDYIVEKDNPALLAAMLKHLQNTRKMPPDEIKKLINEENLEGNIPLLKAVKNHSLRMVKLLVDNGADVNASEIKIFELPRFLIRSLLQYTQACENEWVNIGVSKNTLLHIIASEYGDHSKLLRYLINKGLDVNSTSSSGHNTPLHLASEQGNIKCVQELIKNQASIDRQNDWRSTPLEEAYSKFTGPNELSHKQREATKKIFFMLIKNNANPAPNDNKNMIKRLDKEWPFPFKPTAPTDGMNNTQLMLIENPDFKPLFCTILQNYHPQFIEETKVKTPKPDKSPAKLPEPQTQTRNRLLEQIKLSSHEQMKSINRMKRINRNLKDINSSPLRFLSWKTPALSGGEIVTCKQLLLKDFCQKHFKELEYFFNNLANATKKKKFADVTIHFRWNPWV